MVWEIGRKEDMSDSLGLQLPLAPSKFPRPAKESCPTGECGGEVLGRPRFPSWPSQGLFFFKRVKQL